MRSFALSHDTSRDTEFARLGFAATDLVASMAAFVLVAALLLPAITTSGQYARAAASQGQLRWIAGVTASYAADFQDRQWALSWTEGATISAFPDLQEADTPLQAASNQAVDIMRRRGGESDLPRIQSWIPSVYYSHLPLADYLDVSLPMFEFVSPADEHRLNWARDREAFSLGAFLPFQPEPILPVNKRWPYSSSYQLGVAFTSAPASGEYAMAQGDSQHLFQTTEATRFEGALHSSVRYPSQKVLLSDAEQRTPQRRYFLDEEADVLMLMADGSSSRRLTADSNRGWQPRLPGWSSWTRFRYQPAAWEPQAGAGDLMAGHYRWTRCGVEGRDFGGPEACVPQ